MTPFILNILTNYSSPIGYTDTMCIECTNGIDTLKVDNWKVK